MINEIAPGLVLHLDPDELEKHGGTYACAKHLRVRGGHFFLCLSVQGTAGRWAPMYSDDPRKERLAVSSEGRSGHWKWRDGTFYCHHSQIWLASHMAVELAAKAGGDRSMPGGRNVLDPNRLPAL